MKPGKSSYALCALALAILLSGTRAQAQQYAWSTLAGMPGVAGTADGQGTAARFMSAYGIALDGSGTLYVVDALGSNTLRTITPDGTVTTIAGTPGVYGSADGTGPAAQFSQPAGVALDGSGGLYMVDSWNSTIRHVTPGNVVTTIAGVALDFGTSDGTGSAALFHNPNLAGSDAQGNLYVADSNNSTLRKVTPAGVVTTIAGSAQVAGSTDGFGSAALFYHPFGAAVDGSGNVYVADSSNNTIRKVTPAAVVTTVAGSAGVAGSSDGTGSSALFSFPQGIAVDGSGNVFVVDHSNNTIRKMTPAGVVTTIGGMPGVTGMQEGVGSAALFSRPSAIVVSPDGVVYVTDSGNYRVMMGVPLTGSSGSLTVTISPAAAVSAGEQWQVDGGSWENSGATVTGLSLGTHTVAFSTASGWVTPASQMVTLNGSQTASVAATVAQTPGAGVYSWRNLAGSPGIQGTADGTGSTAQFMNPYGLAMDPNGKVYVIDALGSNTLRTLTPGGTVTTIAGTPGIYGSANGTGPGAQFNQPAAVALDGSGGVYVVDSWNSTIRHVTPTEVVTTIAGIPEYFGNSDGTGSAALFYNPNGGCTDAQGNLYVADSNNSAIRKVTPAGVVTTIAGMGGFSGSADGPVSTALFYHPYGIAMDGSGNIYVADTANNTIRKISSAGFVTTLAGTPGITGTADGAGPAAQFNFPLALALDGSGNVYVTDRNNDTIRKVTPAGVVTTIGGMPDVSGTQDGVGMAAGFSSPQGIAVSPDGSTIYVADTANRRIMLGVTAGGTGPAAGSVFTSNNVVAFSPGRASIVIRVLDSDTPGAGGTLAITGVTQGAFGQVIINADGTITYLPYKTYNGLDSFTYTVTDGVGDTATNTVLIGNGFITGVGTYAGLVTNDAPSNDNSGSFTATLTRTGHYSGKLNMAGLGYGVKGAFDANWDSWLTVPRAARSALTVWLHFDPDNRQITGTVTDGNFYSTIAASALTYNAKLSPAPQTGSFTALLPPDPSTSGIDGFPQGNGYCVLTVSPSGSVTATGKLGDGTPLSASGLLVSGSTFPLYASLSGASYPKPGSIFGNIVFTGSSVFTESCGGALSWFKPMQRAGRYRGGFATATQFTGSRYLAPDPGAAALYLANDLGEVAIDGGDLDFGISESVTLSPANLVLVHAPAGDKVKLALTITPATGVFSGSFYGIENGKPVRRAFSGVLLQSQSRGAGLFMGTSETGSVEFGPPL